MQALAGARAARVIALTGFSAVWLWQGVGVGPGSVHRAFAQGSDADWEIVVEAPSREVIFTNKQAGHIALDTGLREPRSYSGLYNSMHESLDDYVISLDGKPLEPSEAARARVWPWMMRREYEGGVGEEIFLPLNETVLLVRVTVNEAPERFTLEPRLDMRWIWDVPRPSYERVEVAGVTCFRRMSWQPGPGAPAWLAVASSAKFEFAVGVQNHSFTHPRDAARKAMAQTFPRTPGVFQGKWPRGGKQVDFAFGLGDTAEEAAATAKRGLEQRGAWLAAKRDHVDGLLESAWVRTGDARVDRAYRWARASIDALIMNARGRGIYAGFHWFPNYWSRDTFICVPGATLVSGQHEVAREILRSFLRFQEVDRAHPYMGRLPNIVQPGQLQYEGVDGSWWHARASYRYIKARRAAGEADVAYEREFGLALQCMVDGAERMAVDEFGFLRHGDGETWMDAGGSHNPFSPRGDRAVEVQALYYNALRIGEWLAGDRGDGESASWYGSLAQRTRASFRRSYWDEGRQQLADHLNVDGSADFQIRPNTILAITAVEPRWPALLEKEQMEAEINRVWETLVLPYGVTSLDPADPYFHPKHLDLDRYYYDEAYHNGDVWLWLSGPMITALCRVGRVEEAVSMLEPLVDEVLDHGAVGSIREIRDGGDSGLTEEFGGAAFQAWSLAEMVRAMHEDLAPALNWKTK